MTFRLSFITRFGVSLKPSKIGRDIIFFFAFSSSFPHTGIFSGALGSLNSRLIFFSGEKPLDMASENYIERMKEAIHVGTTDKVARPIVTAANGHVN